ncbi:MAG: hypothetical protein HYW01_05300 [Deltaproteobacteria bacterium]|nr:hypothetical protein [Deltaproteobacteria bacterium]
MHFEHMMIRRYLTSLAILIFVASPSVPQDMMQESKSIQGEIKGGTMTEKEK